MQTAIKTLLLILFCSLNAGAQRWPMPIGTTPISSVPTCTNCATWDPAKQGTGTVLSNGNLTVASTASNVCGLATFGKSSGKWYFEITFTFGTQYFVGIATSLVALSNYLGAGAGGWGYWGFNGFMWDAGTQTAYGATYATSVTIGVALDMDNGAVYFAKANVYQNGGVPTSGAAKTGAAVTGLTGTIFPAWGSSGVAIVGTVNFGKTTFTFLPPSGYNYGVYN